MQEVVCNLLYQNGLWMLLPQLLSFSKDSKSIFITEPWIWDLDWDKSSWKTGTGKGGESIGEGWVKCPTGRKIKRPRHI